MVPPTEVLDLVPPGGIPAVLITPPTTCDLREWFRTAGAAAVVTAHAPQFPIALAVPTGVWTRYLAEEIDGRVKAVLREGASERSVFGREDVGQLLSQGNTTRQVPPAILPVVTEGVPGTFVTALVTATTVPTHASTADEDDAARSAAERFLYECLELLPDTAGRFELNADAGFRFGPRAAEVDLLARELRIAIEIDGYYHFRDPDDYRRDRAKDWELQKHGFLVLRFLADDIIPRLEEVRDRILAAVALRTAGSTA